MMAYGLSGPGPRKLRKVKEAPEPTFLVDQKSWFPYLCEGIALLWRRWRGR